MIGRKVERIEGSGGFGADSKSYPLPDADGKIGKLISVNIDKMKVNWVHEQEAMFLTSSLSTAGGLTFIGDLDRYFKAFNSKTGEVLSSTKNNDYKTPPQKSSSVIAEIKKDGEQAVAVKREKAANEAFDRIKTLMQGVKDQLKNPDLSLIHI